MSNWTIAVIVAALFGIYLVWACCKFYKETPVDKRQSLLRVYAGVIVVSVILFFVLNLAVAQKVTVGGDDTWPLQQPPQEIIFGD